MTHAAIAHSLDIKGWKFRRWLKIPREVADLDFQGAGDADEGGQRNLFLAALDPPEVVGMKLRFFGQPLLREPRATSLLANGRAEQHQVVLSFRHSAP